MTPNTKRSDATRQALLRAARDEFAEYGLAGARVDRIAEAAGVNKERIYGLFGSKDKLFDVILIDSLREFMQTVQPLADTEVGDYVAKLFDYHHDNPKLLRLMLWEALHRGADAHDIDGWRADFYERKFDRAQQQFGVDQQRAGLLLIALCGVANWANTLPQTARLLLGDAADDTATIRAFMADFARAALRYDLSSPVIVLTSPREGRRPVPPTIPGRPPPLNQPQPNPDAWTAPRIRPARASAQRTARNRRPLVPRFPVPIPSTRQPNAYAPPKPPSKPRAPSWRRPCATPTPRVPAPTSWPARSRGRYRGPSSSNSWRTSGRHPPPVRTPAVRTFRLLGRPATSGTGDPDARPPLRTPPRPAP